MELIVILVIIGIVVVLGFVLIGMYNGLVAARLRVKEAWSGIDVQLKRRASLIPNLVETVKGYAAHERETLESVTRARAMLDNAGTAQQAAQANNMLTQALRSLFAVAEAYPDLKANQNFLELQPELTDTEEKIAYARQFYNRNVLNYNTKLQTFPTVVIGGMFGFQPEEFFEAEEEAREDVRVDFSIGQPPTIPPSQVAPQVAAPPDVGAGIAGFRHLPAPSWPHGSRSPAVRAAARPPLPGGSVRLSTCPYTKPTASGLISSLTTSPEPDIPACRELLVAEKMAEIAARGRLGRRWRLSRRCRPPPGACRGHRPPGGTLARRRLPHRLAPCES